MRGHTQFETVTAVCVDLAKCDPKSCADEYNYVVRLPIQPVMTECANNYIHVHSFLVRFKINANSTTLTLQRWLCMTCTLCTHSYWSSWDSPSWSASDRPVFHVKGLDGLVTSPVLRVLGQITRFVILHCLSQLLLLLCLCNPLSRRVSLVGL